MSWMSIVWCRGERAFVRRLVQGPLYQGIARPLLRSKAIQGNKTSWITFPAVIAGASCDQGVAREVFVEGGWPLTTWCVHLAPRDQEAQPPI